MRDQFPQKDGYSLKGLALSENRGKIPWKSGFIHMILVWHLNNILAYADSAVELQYSKNRGDISSLILYATPFSSPTRPYTYTAINIILRQTKGLYYIIDTILYRG